MRHKTIFIFWIFIAQGAAAQDQTEAQLYYWLYSGEYHSLSTRLEQMIKVDSTNAELYFLLGLTNTYQNKKSAALKNFEISTGLDPTNIKYMKNYANALVNNGYLNKAEKIFRQAVQLDSSRADIRESLGKLHFRNGKYKEAYSIYTKLSSLDSLNGYYYLMQARCAAKMDSVDRSLSLYLLAHHYDPKNIDIIAEVSGLYLNMDSLANAEHFVRIGLNLDSRDQRLHRLKAEVLYQQEEYTWATLSYLDAIAYGDDSIDVLKKLAYCYFADQNYLKSAEVLKQALQIDQNNPIIYYYLAMCSMQLKQTRQAIDYFNAALRLIHPDYLESLYIGLAECYQHEREYIPAIHCLRKAESLSSSKGIIYYQLANVYYDYYEDRSVARIYYRKALEYDLEPEISEFIHYRIKELTEKIFFKK
jgi:tetratricopeptide (TPR) repeat protein